MAEQYGPFGLSYEQEEKRLHNITLMKRFMSIRGPRRHIERKEFTTERAAMILPFAYGLDPRDDEANRVAATFHQLADMTEQSGGEDNGSSFKEWNLTPEIYYTTADPDKMYCECDGQGMRYDYDQRLTDYGMYKNHYILRFDFADGLLDSVVEPFNTAALYHNFGWHQPPKMML